ncbi:MerR family transcriptional regulator [Nocardia spumae]|uniref:MerR family transcriptional regulator n=1 Tax=Nocardia spumae TaxID=2887190 RepID=UPI001D13D68E|nr:MerR family transcriptional regulator [Nocardia spumae]
MTEATPRDELIGIGALSRSTGVPVRTLRFYCDEGVLDTVRSATGHRLFDPATAAEQVAFVRRLRGLGLGLAAIVEVLRGAVSIGDAVAAERRSLDNELTALRWRRAALVAVETAAPELRAARLERLAAVLDGPHARDGLVAIWRRLLAPMPATEFDGFVEMNVPAPPADPTAAQVLAYADLVCAAADPGWFAAVSRQLWGGDRRAVVHPRELLAGVAEACAAVGVSATAEVEPRPGAELDRFVAAHAAAREVRDTPRFRRRLRGALGDTDPRIHRYWARTGDMLGTTTAGAAQHWLSRALDRDVRFSPAPVKSDTRAGR